MLKLQNFCEKVILDLKKLDKSTSEYQNKFLYMGQVAKDLYPQEFNKFMEFIQLDKDLKMLKKNAQEMLNLIDSYEINPHTKKIIVKMGEEEITKDLISIDGYLVNELKLEKDSWEYLLALSIIADVNTFELFQVAKAIILE